MRLRNDSWGLGAAIVAIVCALVAPASAQPRGKKAPPKTKPVAKPTKPEKQDKPPEATPADVKPDKPAGKPQGTPKEKTFDFNALDLNGRMRTPQLLYFLERANEELERASLEKRSFIPHMVRSVEEEPL